MLVVGITGGIGTGKSLVSEQLKELGAEVIQADAVGHEAYLPGTDGLRAVVEAFGEDVLTPSGEVDRKKLGAIVFNDAVAMKRLNAIMHPRMYRMVEERLEQFSRQGSEVAVVEAAILLEAGWTPLVDELWVTTCAEEQVVQRLRERSNLDEAAVRSRIAAQMDQSEREKHADAIIDNSGSLSELRLTVEKLWKDRIQTKKEHEQKR